MQGCQILFDRNRVNCDRIKTYAIKMLIITHKEMYHVTKMVITLLKERHVIYYEN